MHKRKWRPLYFKSFLVFLKNLSYELLGKLPGQNEPSVLSFDDLGNLLLTYNHGKNCMDGGKVGGQWKTEIVLTCNRNAIVSQLKILSHSFLLVRVKSHVIDLSLLSAV